MPSWVRCQQLKWCVKTP